MEPRDFYVAIMGWLAVLALLLVLAKGANAGTNTNQTQEHDSPPPDEVDYGERSGGPKSEDDTVF